MSDIISHMTTSSKSCTVVTDIPATHPRVPYFARMLEDLRPTQMDWKMSCNGLAYAGAQALHAVIQGKAEMAWVNSAHLEVIEPELAVLNLPFGLDDDHMVSADRVLGLQAAMDAAVRPKGLRVLGLMRGADQLFVAPARHFRTLPELAGARIRVAGPGVYEKLMTSLGAVPVIMPIPHITEAFTHSIVDGVFTSPGGWQTQFGASVPCATRVPGLMFINYALVALGDWFSQLPTELAHAISDAATNQVSARWLDMQRDDETVLRAAESAGARVLLAEDPEAWKACVSPLRQDTLMRHQRFASRLGTMLMK